MLIGGEQPELLGRGAPRHQPRGEAAIEVAHAARRAAIGKPLDSDPHRHAGRALATSRAIGEAVAAAEPGARQIVVERRGGASVPPAAHYTYGTACVLVRGALLRG